MAKRATVDLPEEDGEEDQTRQCSRWTRDEEILLCQCWVEVSENNDIGADQNDDSLDKWKKVYARTRVTYFKKYFKWDALKPLDTDDHTEIFWPDVRPRPAGKTRPAKKTKSETTGSSGGSASGYISDSLSEDLMRKLQATSSAYEAKKEKELAYTECKELEFLMIDPIRCRNLKQALSEINKKK
ncbi:hypothetical protein Tco_0436295 [Tanacetum coccineum]